MRGDPQRRGGAPVVRCWWLMLLGVALGCAEAVEQGTTVCDEARPCAFGAVCVAGFCQPPLPDAARLDAAPVDAAPVDAAPDDAAAPADGGLDDAAPHDHDPPDGDPAAGDADIAPDLEAPDLAPPLDMAPPDAALPDDCGRFGEVCCPGDRCRSGGCLGGTCAAFGGVYAFGGADGVCTVRNPLARDRCACPPGFAEHALEDVDLQNLGGVGISHSIYVCLPPSDDPEADLRGAFAEASDPAGVGCPTGCRPGPLTPGCACPAGATAHAFDAVRYRVDLLAPCPRRLTLCSGPEPLSFGGAWRTIRGTAPCGDIAPAARCAPNARTGACTCPPGFAPLVVPAMAPHPARGEACEADLTICVASP